MQTTVVDHPLAAQALGRLRDQATDRAGFRQAMDDLACLLAVEATRTLPTVEIDIQTPLTGTTGARVDPAPLTVPVLRAGLGLLAGVLRMIPDSPTGFIGLARDEETLEPVPYMDSVPADLGGRPVLILDPMLATGGSLAHAASLLRGRNPGRVTAVCVLAAPDGVDRISRSGLIDDLVVASIDDHLNDQAFIVPGLGDAGDRLFGTA